MSSGSASVRVVLVEVVADDPVRDLAEPLAGARDVELRGGADPHLAVRADDDVHARARARAAPTRPRARAPELLPT